METFKLAVGPAAKAAAGAVVPLVLFIVGWLVEKTGVPIDVDPEKLSQWIMAGIVSLSTYGAVWWQKNHPRPVAPPT